MGKSWLSTCKLVCVACLGLAMAICLSACEKREGYDQSTPDGVLKSALAMVKEDRTGELATLVYADSPDMRATLKRLSSLLVSMQELSKAAKERFPDEFTKMREDAAAAASAGKPTTLLSMLLSQGRGGRGARSGPDPDAARELVNQLFADPYAWLETNAARLSTVQPADDAAYVLLDGQPAIPIIGLAMRKDADKWYVSLPSNVPPISTVWPRSRQQWSILASLIKILDNAVKEMTGDVQGGRVDTLKSLGDKASEKLLFPAGIAFVAYGKELDVRSRVDKRMAQFFRRQGEWVKQRRDDSGGKGVSDQLLSAIGTIAPPLVEKSVRSRKALQFEGVSHVQFEETLRTWLQTEGLSVDFSGDLASPSIDAMVRSWQSQRAKSK